MRSQESIVCIEVDLNIMLSFVGAYCSVSMLMPMFVDR